MPPPVAVYVVAALASVAAVVLFKEFVYEPHIAPQIEAWAEDFLERRRAARNRRASAVPVGTPRRRRDVSSSSDGSHHDDDCPRESDGTDQGPRLHNAAMDEFELEALASREVDEWRNQVLQSQERHHGLRRRRTGQLRSEFDGFDSVSTTLDESFTSLAHSPLASTHVISNLSSPITPSTISLPLTPAGRHRSASQSTTTQMDGDTTIMARHDNQEIPVGLPTPRSLIDDIIPLEPVPPPALAIPNGIPHPLAITPTHETTADDSPFGPLLPDTPRSSAEIYGERPFSPITRGMGSSSSYTSTGSRGMLSSMANSTSSFRTVGAAAVRRSSGLANEVTIDAFDDEHGPHTFTSTFSHPDSTNGSVMSSLSERYPVAPTPPVIVSPPASSIGFLSSPSSPGGSGSEVVVRHDSFSSQGRIHPSVLVPPLLPDPTQARPISATTSPALSYASFLSPMPLSRTASESEGDEFLSVRSDDDSESEHPWASPGEFGRSRVNSSNGPVSDRGHNPFLDFEHLTRESDGSEGSEVFVGHEGGSEIGSDESWGEVVGR